MITPYASKEACCGCTACYESCPKQAITMVEDNEGFFYPQIDETKCVNCNICHAVCAFKRNEKILEQNYYAAKACDDTERMLSRSGGAFFVAAKAIISQKGVVYGTIIRPDNTVSFDRAETIKGCERMRGSKYVESDIQGMYPLVKQDLSDGRMVLFSGTACQVAGLYSYLKHKKIQDYRLTQLFTMDIVCHGVISSKILKDYISFVESKYGGPVSEFNFRNKKYGWDSHVETFMINHKEYVANNYTQLFYSNMGLRPSCGNCQFANYDRPGDISLADYWDLERAIKGFDDNKGVSNLIVNSKQGHVLLKWLKKEMIVEAVSKEACVQPNLKAPSKIPNNREEFWDTYQQKGIKGVLVKFGRYDIIRRMLWVFRDYPRLKSHCKK